MIQHWALASHDFLNASLFCFHGLGSLQFSSACLSLSQCHYPRKEPSSASVVDQCSVSSGCGCTGCCCCCSGSCCSLPLFHCLHYCKHCALSKTSSLCFLPLCPPFDLKSFSFLLFWLSWLQFPKGAQDCRVAAE